MRPGSGSTVDAGKTVCLLMVNAQALNLSHGVSWADAFVLCTFGPKCQRKSPIPPASAVPVFSPWNASDEHVYTLVMLACI